VSPSAALAHRISGTPEADKAARAKKVRSGNGELHGLTSITAAVIGYAAVQVSTQYYYILLKLRVIIARLQYVHAGQLGKQTRNLLVRRLLSKYRGPFHQTAQMGQEDACLVEQVSKI
jgi:hypothetical protein